MANVPNPTLSIAVINDGPNLELRPVAPLAVSREGNQVALNIA